MKKRALFACLLLLAICFYASSTFQKVEPNTGDKHRGVHVFGYLDTLNIQALLRNHVDWITVVPFGDQKDFDSAHIRYSSRDSTTTARRDSLWKSQITIAHAADFNVFFKPHIWIYEPSDGKWRSDIFPTNDDNWQLWQAHYRDFILMYAEIAEQNKVELFCIGTEFSRLSVEKTAYWRQLIKDVRAVYSGQLTYAANWYQEFEQITFWEDLDFIGIQAYFPLADKEYPSIKEISAGWERHLPAIEHISKKYNRQVLFTEIGYKSTPNSAIKPWEWMDYESTSPPPVSMETQANCYAAFFQRVWQKEWFAGVHIWQWRSEYMENGGKDDLDFTPQRKLAEEVIRKGFERK